jgi:hypothetical protein
LLLDLAGDGRAVAEQLGRGGDVEEGLIDRELLDQLGVALEDRHDPLGDLGVELHAGVQVDGVGAAPVGLGDRHGRVDAELAGRVVAGGDHAAAAAAARVGAHDDGPVGDRRILARLDGGEEGVHVGVENRSDHIVLR